MSRKFGRQTGALYAYPLRTNLWLKLTFTR
jgi:hypothetical protein